MPRVLLQGVSLSFGASQVVFDVDLEVEEGEFVTLLGPSGCGKTTTLRMIAGFETPTEGAIRLEGKDVSRVPPHKRNVNTVFQHYALFPHMSVWDNVAYGPRSQKKDKAEVKRRVDELLEIVRLTDFAQRKPAQLSGGQQQRVALARALVNYPSALLLDEPLGALDLKLRQVMQFELKRIQREVGITFVYVTHDQEEALTLADRVAVMDHGVIEQVGAPIEVYRQPASRFVADFVGSMNVIEAEIVTGSTARLGTRELRLMNGTHQAGAAHLCIRPEDIVVREVGEATVNAISVRVEALEFTGPSFRAVLRPEGSEAALVANLSANDVSDLGLAAGQTIRAALPIDRIRLYPREG